jgi:hypothetical protein
MLTGCGSKASQDNTTASGNTAGNSAGADAQNTPADDKKDETAEEEIVYSDNYDTKFSIPYPASLKKMPNRSDIIYATKTYLDEEFLSGETLYDENEVVFFHDLMFYNNDNVECNLDTLLEDHFLKDIDVMLRDYYDKSTNEDISRYTIDENTEEDFLGTPARRISGTIKAGYDSDGEYIDVHFVAHLCIPETNRPFMTFTCTASNDKEKLDTMTHIADLITTKIKKYEP